MKTPFLVIGGGLSGLAAAIRAARFVPDVLLFEKHSRLGGLNSYFYRNKTLFETGLHAITNYAVPGDKRAPLNRLLRQLKIKRKSLSFCQQYQSEILFQGCESLAFSNDLQLLTENIGKRFPKALDNFHKLLLFLESYDPFAIAPFSSAKTFLQEILQDTLLAEMLLCPLMYYGSSHENDMDLNQFAIMFRAIYLEGMFRPEKSIKEFIELLRSHYEHLGGVLKTGCGVREIIIEDGSAKGVLLDSGEFIECNYILSTIGVDETMQICSTTSKDSNKSTKRLGFVESIFQVPTAVTSNIKKDNTIIFYNKGSQFNYQIPLEHTDFSSGVICFPGNFHGLTTKPFTEIRSTHLANYARWKETSADAQNYAKEKINTAASSKERLENMIGSFSSDIVYENTFTPITIERYTSKIGGAIYGHPGKIKDGDLGFSNLFLAGTDQGFLGIVGSMLSGVSIVNQHILPKL